MINFLKLAPTALGACSQKSKSFISYTIITYFGIDFLVGLIRKRREILKILLITLSNGTDRHVQTVLTRSDAAECCI